MSLRLEHLPNEIIERIVVLLDLTDICNLRLSGRVINEKATQDHFKSFIRTKSVDIERSALEKFVSMTQVGRLGCEIRHLILVGVVNNTKLLETLAGEEERTPGMDQRKRSWTRQNLDALEQRRASYEELHDTGTDVALISEAFRNILQDGRTTKLLSLSLQVTVYRDAADERLSPLQGGSWRYIWQSATETFHTAMSSLAANALPVERLNIFNDRQLQRCSLPCNELGNVKFNEERLTESLASLKSLSLSFSNRVIYTSKHDSEFSYDSHDDMDYWGPTHEARDAVDIRREASDEANFIGLAKLLQSSNQLEELELHQYSVGNFGLNPLQLHNEKLLHNAITIASSSLQNLKRVELRGTETNELDLLTLLQQTRLRDLSLYQVTLSKGLFNPIFDYCTGDEAEMKRLHFERLVHDKTGIVFEEPGQTRASWVLDRSTEKDIKRPIVYCKAPHVQSSPAEAERRRQRAREYGPPFKATVMR